MVVHALKSTAVRGTRAAVAASQKRSMGGSSAPAPEWTGIDAVVRKYLPQDDQRKCFFVFVCRCWGEIHGGLFVDCDFLPVGCVLWGGRRMSFL